MTTTDEKEIDCKDAQIATVVERKLMSEEPRNEMIQSDRGGVSAEMLIQRAIDANVPVESLERLLEMRRVLKAESAKEEFFRAFAAFQVECPSVQKQAVADAGNYKYNFAPMDHIRSVIAQPLKRNGFSYTFDADYEQVGQMTVQKVTCILHHIGGHSESSKFTAPLAMNTKMNDTQKAASALTYCKRYALCGVLGLTVGNDIDGYTPPEHGAPRRGNDAPTAQPRGDRVEREEAIELMERWTKHRTAANQPNSGDDWSKWFADVTGKPADSARNASLWSPYDFTLLSETLQRLGDGEEVPF